MQKVIFSFLLFHIAISFSYQPVADPKLYLVKLTDPDALCLDGSPGAYYISKSGDPKKIYIEFEGGGWCQGPNTVGEIIQSCYQRSKTTRGSSTQYDETLQLDEGVLSTNQNNIFKDWTRVFFKYCDGSGHQGSKTSPILYKDTKLYFRGHNITVAKLNSLQRTNKVFSEATHVVVGGHSAGGLAVFLWTNYIKERVKVGKVWAISDSGVFLDSQNIFTGKHDYKNQFKNLMSITNVEIAPPVPQCALKFKSQIENCMFAVNLAPYIKTPIFMIQSLYDSWSIPNILGVPCIIDSSLAYCDSIKKRAIEEYHRNTTNTIFEIAANNQNGFFAPACSDHVYGYSDKYYNPNVRIPAYSDYSISKSIQNWMGDNSDPTQYRRIDLINWPENRPCAGQVTPWNVFSKVNWLRKND